MHLTKRAVAAAKAERRFGRPDGGCNGGGLAFLPPIWDKKSRRVAFYEFFSTKLNGCK